ncbi:MAG: hypothetical protein WAK93_02240 [Solirubrobacteraceae bacterium]
MTLSGLHEALVLEGGTIAETLAPAPGGNAGRAGGPPQLAASGPRAAGREHEYELLLEMILEGSLLHYGSPRLVRVEDPDLALLLGDQLYALGLSRLAALDDLDAVAELADLISLLAQAQAASDQALARAVWEAGATAIGWGSSSEHEAAKALARAGGGGAAEALLRAARKDLQAGSEGPVA